MGSVPGEVTMIRVCYSNFHIGERVFGEKEPLEDKRETHGLCESCFGKEMEIIEQVGTPPMTTVDGRRSTVNGVEIWEVFPGAQ